MLKKVVDIKTKSDRLFYQSFSWKNPPRKLKILNFFFRQVFPLFFLILLNCVYIVHVLWKTLTEFPVCSNLLAEWKRALYFIGSNQKSNNNAACKQNITIQNIFIAIILSFFFANFIYSELPNLIQAEAHSEPYQRFKMQFLTKIVNSSKGMFRTESNI